MKPNHEIYKVFVKTNPETKGPGPLVRETMRLLVQEWKGIEKCGWFVERGNLND